jgi:hypothetical protein
VGKKVRPLRFPKSFLVKYAQRTVLIYFLGWQFLRRWGNVRNLRFMIYVDYHWEVPIILNYVDDMDLL